jgi:hypothetical protein
MSCCVLLKSQAFSGSSYPNGYEYGQWNPLVELIDEDCEATRRTFRANASYVIGLYCNIEYRTQQQQHNQNGNHNNRRPGNNVETEFVHMTTHQATIVDQ